MKLAYDIKTNSSTTRKIIGRTKKKALITVCVNCEAFSHIPHFNCKSKKYDEAFSLLSAKIVDSPANIELSDRTDIEEFLNKIVTIKDIQKINKMCKKLNKKQKYKYESIDIADIEPDMTYWELIIKIWNKYNKEKTPKNLYKPYYINLIEMIDSACFGGSNEYLEGGKCYTMQDQERTPHFIYELNTGEKFGILFEKAEYLYPISRKLTQQELDVLIRYLKAPVVEKLFKCKNYWELGILMWNDQNYDCTNYSPKYFPKYKKIDENTPMPDYSKLNEDSNL